MTRRYARMIRARTNSGEQVERPAVNIREGAWPTNRAKKALYTRAVRGNPSKYNLPPFRTRAARRHNRPAPFPRLPYTATAAPGLGRVDGPQNTRRTGGRSPGRDPHKIFISKSSEARRTNPPVNVVRKRPGHVQESPRRMAGACGGSTAAQVLADLPPMEWAAAAARVFPLGNQKKSRANY